MVLDAELCSDAAFVLRVVCRFAGLFGAPAEDWENQHRDSVQTQVALLRSRHSCGHAAG